MSDNYICRICKNEYDEDLGDVFILICDECAADYNIDKIWKEYESGILSEDDLQDLDLDNYRIESTNYD